MGSYRDDASSLSKYLKRVMKKAARVYPVWGVLASLQTFIGFLLTLGLLE